MSSIAKKFFVASLIYLILGLFSQAVAVFDVWLGFNPLAHTTIVATEQIFLLGWLTQLGLALVYDRWLSSVERDTKPSSKIPPPLTRTGTYKQNPPGKCSKSKIENRKSALVVFLLFNIGLPLVIIGQPGLALLGGRWLGAAAAFGGLLQLFAGLVVGRDVWRTLKRR